MKMGRKTIAEEAKRKPISFTLSQTLINKLKNESCCNKSNLVEKILTEYFEKNNKN